MALARFSTTPLEFGYKEVVRSVHPPLRLALVGLLGLSAGACGQAPSALAPQLEGSIGMPHRGVLTRAAELPRHGEGFRWLDEERDTHYGLPRFVTSITRAAAVVSKERPGPELAIGDLSAPHGGHLAHHASHRTGRDADLLLYATTLDGAPVPSPGWVRFGPDGLGFDAAHGRFLRFDVAREWLLLRTLLADEGARIQFIFLARPLQAMLLEWARARGDDPDLIIRAMEAMVQPAPPAEAHDDHAHVRTACTADEIAAGCEPTGPSRAWIHTEAPRDLASSSLSTRDLLDAILRPIVSPRPSPEGALVGETAGR